MLVWSGRCADTDTEVHVGADTWVVHKGRFMALKVHCATAPLIDHPA